MFYIQLCDMLVIHKIIELDGEEVINELAKTFRKF